MSESAKTEHPQPAPPDVAETEPRPYDASLPISEEDAAAVIAQLLIETEILFEQEQVHVDWERIQALRLALRRLQPRGRPAYAVCRCGHWETDHDAGTTRCGRCRCGHHGSLRQGYTFYEYLHELRMSITEAETIETGPPRQTRSPARQDNSRWQSIETAPKDGTRVLLLISDEITYEVVGSYMQWDNGQPPEGSYQGVEHRNGWTNDYDGSYITEAITHWMPLPPSPSEET